MVSLSNHLPILRQAQDERNNNRAFSDEATSGLLFRNDPINKPPAPLPSV